MIVGHDISDEQLQNNIDAIVTAALELQKSRTSKSWIAKIASLLDFYGIGSGVIAPVITKAAEIQSDLGTNLTKYISGALGTLWGAYSGSSDKEEEIDDLLKSCFNLVKTFERMKLNEKRITELDKQYKKDTSTAIRELSKLSLPDVSDEKTAIPRKPKKRIPRDKTEGAKIEREKREKAQELRKMITEQAKADRESLKLAREKLLPEAKKIQSVMRGAVTHLGDKSSQPSASDGKSTATPNSPDLDTKDEKDAIEKLLVDVNKEVDRYFADQEEKEKQVRTLNFIKGKVDKKKEMAKAIVIPFSGCVGWISSIAFSIKSEPESPFLTHYFPALIIAVIYSGYIAKGKWPQLQLKELVAKTEEACESRLRSLDDKIASLARKVKGIEILRSRIQSGEEQLLHKMMHPETLPVKRGSVSHAANGVGGVARSFSPAAAVDRLGVITEMRETNPQKFSAASTPSNGSETSKVVKAPSKLAPLPDKNKAKNVQQIAFTPSLTPG